MRSPPYTCIFVITRWRPFKSRPQSRPHLIILNMAKKCQDDLPSEAPRGQRTRGPSDQMSTGPEDQGTRGPSNHRTERPADQGTRGPRDQRGTVLVLGLLTRKALLPHLKKKVCHTFAKKTGPGLQACSRSRKKEAFDPGDCLLNHPSEQAGRPTEAVSGFDGKVARQDRARL